ncbi:MAG: FKBP-type peptidyl-prolyl cis-trans isomerase [Actinomycetota bacterium]
MRNLALVSTTLLLAATLTGCAASVDYACEPYSEGDQVKSVNVEGELGAVPEVSFPSPINPTAGQTRTVIEGEGPTYTGRNYIEFEFAAYNGGTGEVLQETSFDGSEPLGGFFNAGETPNFCSALAGARTGSRIVTIIPPAEAHEGNGIPELGIGANDSLVLVFDIVKVYLAKATGQSQLPQAGFPSVVTTPEGIPGVTMPKTDAPTELKIAQLIKGEGEVIEEGQKVTLHYSGFLWSDGSKFDSSWDSGRPVQFDMVEGGLIPGFLNAVIGQPIGSQVIAVIPPDQAYGDQGSGSIPPGSTLVFVIDILGVSN